MVIKCSNRVILNKALPLVLALSVSLGIVNQCWAADAAESSNTNTGALSGSIQGNGNQQANGAGIGVNGDANGANLNNNQNRNSNANIILPQYVSSGQGGGSAIIMPRNPLPLGNAANGRSNFGLQFGVQNNPGVSTLTGGKENGLGWFAQAGVTIPFGKIPLALQNPRNGQMDTIRQDYQDAQRQVFGNAMPSQSAEARVQGKVVGVNAYNYSTVPAAKIPVQTNVGAVSDIVLPQPKLLALKPADVFSQPLNTGERVGLVEVGKEYPYLGHTRSGWVKLLLPNGKEGWTSSNFEYIKFDYTQVDSLAVDPSMMNRTRSATAVKDHNVRRRRS